MMRTLHAGARLPEMTAHLSTRHIVQGAAASRDWQPLHHDHQWARQTAGTADIILNTPSQAGWMLRYITDQLGADCRIGAIKLRMKRPVTPGSELVFTGLVHSTEADPAGFDWVYIDVMLQVADRTASEAQVSVARPGATSPWSAKHWRPRVRPR